MVIDKWAKSPNFDGNALFYQKSILLYISVTVKAMTYIPMYISKYTSFSTLSLYFVPTSILLSAEKHRLGLS